MLKSLLQNRTVAMIHTRTFERVDMSCRFMGPRKLYSPLTWSMCNYAKKAGKDKKGKQVKGAKVELSQEDIGDIIDIEQVKTTMQEVVNRLKENYIQNLNLRTSLGTFDTIIVDTDDGKFHLNQLGQIVQKNPQLLMINLGTVPQHMKAVKTALDNSGMNINAQQEGNALFIPIPKVTREHRENLVKNAKILFDKTKTQLTSLHNKHTKKVNSVKSKHSEDLIRNINNTILDIMHKYTAEAEQLMEKKQKELLG